MIVSQDPYSQQKYLKIIDLKILTKAQDLPLAGRLSMPREEVFLEENQPSVTLTIRSLDITVANVMKQRAQCLGHVTKTSLGILVSRSASAAYAFQSFYN